MHPAARLALVVTAALVAAGCSTAAGSLDPTQRPASVSASPAPSGDTPTPIPTSDPGPDDPAIPACDADVEAGVDATVSAQLDALARGDFRTALGYASEAFRSGVTVKGFRAIIRGGFPEVATARAHTIVDCRQLGSSQVQALVAVTGEGGSVARVGYRFVLEPGGWRIDGASTLDTTVPQSA